MAAGAEIPKLPRCKVDDEDMEKLHQAARRGNAEVVARLIAGSVPVSIQNKFGCTALHLAVKHGYLNVMRELNEYKPVLTMPWHGKQPLHIAVIEGRMDVLEELVAMAEFQELDIPSFLNETDEFEASEVGVYELDVPTSGQTALHWAVGCHNVEIMKYLIKKGAGVNIRDKLGYTCLLRAIEFNLEDVLKELLSHRPNLHIQDRRGVSALHLSLHHHRLDIAKTLLECCPPQDLSSLVTLEDERGKSPFVLAIEMGEIQLVTLMLTNLDPFLYQQQKFHDARTVHPEKIDWCDQEKDPRKKEERQEEVIRLLQIRLDELNAANEEPTRKSKKNAPITVAPSAPIKKSDRSR